MLVSRLIFSNSCFSVEYTISSVKAVDDRGGQIAKKKARILAAAVGEAFYAVRLRMSYL